MDTSCEKVEQAVAIIGDELGNHEGLDPNHPPRVFFHESVSETVTVEITRDPICSASELVGVPNDEVEAVDESVTIRADH